MNGPAFLTRLFPKRLQQREELSPDERRELFARVPEGDACLRATLDLVQEEFRSEFGALINVDATPEQVSNARAALRAHYRLLHRIEDERAAARQWRADRERQQP